MIAPRALPCLIATLALACVCAAPVQAATSSSADGQTAQTSKAAKKQKAQSAPRIIKSPGQETTAERERRLKRECKGMPNAGACLGYAA